MTKEQRLLIQASAVAIKGRALIIQGQPGRGKSTLALELIDRGAILIGDDGVSLVARDGTLIASPPPNISGKLEIRGVGIVELPTVLAPVALILEVDTPSERLPDKTEPRDYLGLSIPVLPFDPLAKAAPIRAEWALRRFGLSRFGN